MLPIYLYYCVFIKTFIKIEVEYIFFKLNKPSTSNGNGTSNGDAPSVTVPDDICDFYGKIDKEDEEDEVEDLKTVSFEINQHEIENLQKR